MQLHTNQNHSWQLSLPWLVYLTLVVRFVPNLPIWFPSDGEKNSPLLPKQFIKQPYSFSLFTIWTCSFVVLPFCVLLTLHLYFYNFYIFTVLTILTNNTLCKSSCSFICHLRNLVILKSTSELTHAQWTLRASNNSFSSFTFLLMTFKSY